MSDRGKDNDSLNWRVRIGQPQTVGELREMLQSFSDDAPLAVRNAPLPVLYYMACDGRGYVEIEIPSIRAACRDCGAPGPLDADGLCAGCAMFRRTWRRGEAKHE